MSRERKRKDGDGDELQCCFASLLYDRLERWLVGLSSDGEDGRLKTRKQVGYLYLPMDGTVVL